MHGCLLYYITDRTAFASDEPTRCRRLLEKVKEAARAGVDYIQLRERNLSTRELECLAREAVHIVREATNLSASGVREINLIGQDTTYYGEDLGIRDGLPMLLARLAQIEDLSWIRFLYCYPNRITPKLLDTIAEHPRLAKYLDIPLQHASRSVLARMKRGSNADAFLKMLEKIRRAIPGVAVRTSFIVGFPGETEADFRELCDFVCAAELDWMGVFAYSDEDAAKSFSLQGKIDERTIASRREKIMSIQEKISTRKLRRRPIGCGKPKMRGLLCWWARSSSLSLPGAMSRHRPGDCGSKSTRDYNVEPDSIHAPSFAWRRWNG